MRFTLSHIYEYDTETVLSVFMNRDYLKKKYESMGREPVEFVEYGETQGRFRATTRRRLPGLSSRDVPRIARRFVRDSYTLKHTVEWELEAGEVKHGHLYMHVQDMPVAIEGAMVLRPAEKGCVKAFDLRVQSNIPVVGRKVEQEAEKLVRQALDKEYAFTQQYLRKHAASPHYS